MSDLTTNSRYSSDSISAGRLPTQNVTLPKSQPVRLKALLHLCESDEDDDDDDDDDNESEKSPQSENESDFNESLLQDNSAEDILQETLILKAGINSSSIESTDGILKTTCVLPKENYEVVTNTPIQGGINFAIDGEQRKVSDVNSESHIPVSDSSKLETCSSKYEEKTQEYHSGTFTSRSQTDTVNRSTNIALPLLSVYKEDYNTKFDTNKNLQPINSNQLHHENAYMSDILNKKKEGSMYNTSVENKILLTRNSAGIELNLSKDDQRYKDTYGFIEQTNKDCEEESHNIPNPLSESATCISQTSENLMHPVRYNSQKNVMKYETNEKIQYTPAKNTCTEFSTPSVSKSFNQLVSETPLKLVQVGVHPSPCTSHKQLFQTPQNKLSNDMKNHVQTPSTILSSWYYNSKHTPMEGKGFVAKDHMQMSRNAVCTPIMEKPNSSRSVIIFCIYNYIYSVIFYN